MRSISRLEPTRELKLNYLELHTDLPLWLLVMVHDLLVIVARITGHTVTAFGPMGAEQSAAFHIKMEGTLA